MARAMDAPVRQESRRRRRSPAPAGPLAIAYRAVSELIEFAGNPRTHPPGQVSRIAASIREFGFTNPILLGADDVIIAGHGRVLAAKELGLASVPTIRLEHLSDKQRRALVVADNQLALGSGWDLDRLRDALGLIKADGFDLTNLIGFEAMDLASLFNRSGGLTDPDAAPPLPKVVTTRAGDVWLLGRHRLLCGDATKRVDTESLLPLFDGVPNLMVTDPPYGVGYDADWRNRAVMIAGERVGQHGSRAVGTVSNDDRADWTEAWHRFPGNVAYVWHGGLHGGVVQPSLATAGFEIRAQIVWVKTRPVISRGAYHWQHEPALYAVKPGTEDGWARFVDEHEVAGYAVRKGKRADWQGGRKQSTVWFIEHLKSDTGHSTQKPVECMRKPIDNNSRPGDAVYDPFVGSGTTIIAAEMAARCCLAIEIDPGYCDVSVERWQAFTGAEAVLHATGQSFAEVRAARGTAAARSRRGRAGGA